MAKAKADAFDVSNEVASSFIKWGKEGDFILGTLTSTRQVPSTLPDKKGELQFIYEIKVDSGEYHDIDEKKRVAEEPTPLDVGSTWSVGGRKTIDARMRQIKIGQKVGLKFIEELESKLCGIRKALKGVIERYFRVVRYTFSEEDGQAWLKEQVEQALSSTPT